MENCKCSYEQKKRALLNCRLILSASVYDYMGQPNLNSMFINPVNEAEVIRIIKLCKPKDSMDYDDINM